MLALLDNETNIENTICYKMYIWLYHWIVNYIHKTSKNEFLMILFLYSYKMYIYWKTSQHFQNLMWWCKQFLNLKKKLIGGTICSTLTLHLCDRLINNCLHLGYNLVTMSGWNSGLACLCVIVVTTITGNTSKIC